jgi:hypothetical protein
VVACSSFKTGLAAGMDGSSLDELSSRAQTAARLIADADVLVFCSGAGLGVDSGVGTFRGANAGKWPPLEQRKMEFSQMSQPSWFMDDGSGDPELAFGFWCVFLCAIDQCLTGQQVLALRCVCEQERATRWLQADAQVGLDEATQGLLLHEQH